MTPISLLAAITLTSAVAGVIASAMAINRGRELEEYKKENEALRQESERVKVEADQKLQEAGKLTASADQVRKEALKWKDDYQKKLVALSRQLSAMACLEPACI